MAFNITIAEEQTDFGDTPDETLTLANCVVEDISYAQGDPTTIELSFELLGAVGGSVVIPVPT